METKWIVFSKTVFGAVLMALAAASQYLGWTWWADVQPMVQETLNGVLGVIGLVFNIVGRVKASKKVTLLPRVNI